MVRSRNDSQLYEYPLENPLAFQEGDILGYFQPSNGQTQLKLHLEDSSSLTTYYYNVPGMGIEPPDGEFDLISHNIMQGDEYPLIGVETGSGISTLSHNS